MPPVDVQCPDCHKKFSNKYNMANHLLRCKGPLHRPVASQSATCELCKRTLSTPYKLVAHKKVCRGTQRVPTTDPPKCTRCDRILSSKASLERHKLTCRGPSSPRPLHCDECGFKTPRRYVMQRHQQTCKPQLRCRLSERCKLFRFPRRALLECHLRVVHGMTREEASAHHL
mgnify:CR=1 FL=1